MHKRWDPTAANIKQVLGHIDHDKLYTRQQAIDELGLSGSAFDRSVRLNSLWLAYGQPAMAGRMTLYPGQELDKQFRRLGDPTAALHLLDLYYHASDDEFLREIGTPRTEVFAEGTYLAIGGWKGTDY